MGGGAQLKFVTLATRIQGGPVRVLLRRLRMSVTQRGWAARWLTRLGIVSTNTFEERMKRLNLIHFARWYVIARLPAVPGCRRSAADRRAGRLVMFVSNFDRDVAEYVDAFADAFGAKGLDSQWKDAPGWRDQKTVAHLTRFAIDHNRPLEVEYKAYDWASTNDVRSALRVDRELRSFLLETDPNDDPFWEQRFEEMLARVQHCLGRIPSPTNVPPWDEARLASRGRTRSFLLMLPFRARCRGKVETAIAEVDAAQTFQRLGGVHTARLGIIDHVFDQELFDLGRSISGRPHGERPLRHPLIVCSAEFQSNDDLGNEWEPAVHDFVDRLIRRTWDTNLWASSADVLQLANRDDFLAYCTRRRGLFRPSGPLYPPTMEFVDYPNVGPDGVIRALLTHNVLERFVLDTWLETDAQGRHQRLAHVSKTIRGVHPWP